MSRRALLRLAVAGALNGSALAFGAGAARLRAQSPVAGATSLPLGALALVSGNSLWLVGTDGRRRSLASGAGGWLQDPAWSPDGSRIAFSRFQLPQSVAVSGSAGVPGILWPTADLYTVHALEPGATAIQVARHEAPNEALTSASWTPDGRALYAVRRRPVVPGSRVVATDLVATDLVATDLVRIDLVTGALAVVDAGVAPAELAVADDGTLAVVAVLDPLASGTAPEALYLLAPDGTRTEIASTAQGFEYLALPRFAPGGRRVAFAAGAKRVASVTEYVGASRTASRLSAPRDLRRDAPGGSRIERSLGAKVAYAHGTPAWPWIADLDRGDLWQVPIQGLDDLTGLAWLPDGRRLLILDVLGLAVVDVDDGTLLRVPEITGNGFAWLATL